MGGNNAETSWEMTPRYWDMFRVSVRNRVGRKGWTWRWIARKMRLVFAAPRHCVAQRDCGEERKSIERKPVSTRPCGGWREYIENGLANFPGHRSFVRGLTVKDMRDSGRCAKLDSLCLGLGLAE